VTVAYFTLFVAFIFGPFQVLGPQVARLALGGPGAWAAISTALSLGAVAGGGLGLRWRPRYPLRASFGAFLVAGPALFASLAAHAALALIVAVALLEGAAATLFTVFWQTALQHEIPACELSRVSSWDYLGSLALWPVGLALCGPIAVALGLSTTLYAAGVLFLVLLVGILAVPSVRNFSLSARSAAASDERASITDRVSRERMPDQGTLPAPARAAPIGARVR
jgi:hypothetical protein